MNPNAETARNITADLLAAYYVSPRPESQIATRFDLRAAITAALDAAREAGRADYRHHLVDIQATGLCVVHREGEPNRLAAPKGHILTDDGIVRKVLGTLPLTKDGVVMGTDARMYLDSGAEVKPNVFICQIPTPIDMDPSYYLEDCYSTRAAAESSKGVSRE